MILVPADERHVPDLAVRMRQADRIEVEALGRSPRQALRVALASSSWALTAVVDGEPHAMMGVMATNMIDGVGVPWMLGSELIYDHARDLIRYGPGIIAEMRSGFERLENVVHVENDRALSFLRHFGFRFSEQQEAHGGLNFVRFTL